MDLNLPELGEQTHEGTVLRVLVSEGDRVSEGDPVLEIESDKATTEVPATAGGVVETVHVRDGDVVEVGQTLVTLREGGDDQEAEDAPVGAKDAAARGEADDGGEGGEDEGADEEEADGDGEDEGADEEEADGDGEDEGADDGDEGARRHAYAPSAARAPVAHTEVDASPAVRKLARELGVDIDDVPGTGRGGRISTDDVKAFVRDRLADAGRRDEDRDEDEDAGPQLPDFSRFGPVRREPLGAVRRATAGAVARSWDRIPHVTQEDLADVTDAEGFRRRARDALRGRDGEPVPLTWTALLVRALGDTLPRFPALGSSLDLTSAERVVKAYVHVGVAVDTDDGLLVPVVRDADRKGLAEIAGELRDLAERARSRSLPREAMEGATFTLTNLGGLGATRFTPIVPWPQVAILGVGRMAWQPRYPEGGGAGVTPTPRRILPFSLSYDHRAVDGAAAARFLRALCQLLEEPFLTWR